MVLRASNKNYDKPSARPSQLLPLEPAKHPTEQPAKMTAEKKKEKEPRNEKLLEKDTVEGPSQPFRLFPPSWPTSWPESRYTSSLSYQETFEKLSERSYGMLSRASKNNTFTVNYVVVE